MACNVAVDYIYSPDKEIENKLFDSIELSQNNIYKAANDNNIQLILNLTKKSFLYTYFLQFNSAIKISQILRNKEDKGEAGEYIVTCLASILTLNQIKLNLLKSLPKYWIRIYFNKDYLANTILNYNITIYNEK